MFSYFGTNKNHIYPLRINLYLDVARCIVVFLFFRFCCSFVYYGLTLASPTLGGNVYVNYSLSSMMEVLSVFYCQLTLNRFGRMWPLRGALFAGGIGLLATLVVPNGESKYL